MSEAVRPNTTRPLMLGYVSELFLMTDSELAELKRRLASFAHAEGYVLGTVFVERLDRSPAAFQALKARLERQEARAVVIPSMQHLTVLGGAASLKQQLEYRTGARVLIADPP